MHSPLLSTFVIPFAWRDDVKKDIDTIVSQNIIEPVGDEACECWYPISISVFTKAVSTKTREPTQNGD